MKLTSKDRKRKQAAREGREVLFSGRGWETDTAAEKKNPEK